MAWRKRAWTRARSYGSRFYAGARRYGGKSWSYGKGGYKVQLGMPFLIGLAIGMTDIDNMIPAPVKIGAACLPVSGPVIGPVKAVAQGMLLGDVIQHYTGVSLPVLGGLGAASSNGTVI